MRGGGHGPKVLRVVLPVAPFAGNGDIVVVAQPRQELDRPRRTVPVAWVKPDECSSSRLSAAAHILFVPQRLDRIEPRCLVRREEAEEHPDSARESKGN